MKSRLIQFTLIILFFIFSCKKKDSMSFEEILKSNSWTQKIEPSYNGQLKMFYRLTFQDDGYCIIVYDNLLVSGIPDPIELDTIQIKYSIENNRLLFPQPYGEVNNIDPNDSTMLNAYVCDWEKKSFSNDILYIERIDNPEKIGYILGLQGIDLEPID